MVTVALVALAMVIGVVGTVVPLVPGLGLVTAAAFVYGLLEGFGAVGWTAMAFIIVLAIAGTAAGIVLPKRAAGAAGASRASLLIGASGAIAGFFLLPVIGLPIGGALGIYAGERMRTGRHQPSWRTTVATLKGIGVGAVVQIAAGVAMVVTWVVWVLLR